MRQRIATRPNNLLKLWRLSTQTHDLDCLIMSFTLSMTGKWYDIILQVKGKRETNM